MINFSLPEVFPRPRNTGMVPFFLPFRDSKSKICYPAEFPDPIIITK